MSLGLTGGSPIVFSPTPTTSTADQLVPLYALMSGSVGAASPALVASLEAVAQAADREPTPPAPAAQPSAPAAQPPGANRAPAASVNLYV